jgi:hypothetical protein
MKKKKRENTAPKQVFKVNSALAMTEIWDLKATH